MISLDKLEQFRKYTYEIIGNGRDALFDLMDAVLTSRSVSSFVELSLSPLFRREWSSIYEALQDSHPPREDLMKQYIQQMPAAEVTILAGDHTAWSRPYAVTLQERTYEHQPQPGVGSKPVTVGQGYSTIAWIPESEGSFALPLRHERITSFENPIQKAASQLRLVCAEIPGTVLFLGDGEYGCAPFLQQTADIPCIKLLRLRPNRVLYHAPKDYEGHGRPHKHGEKFSLKDSDTWSIPQADITIAEPKLGRLQIRRWPNLHLKQAADHPFTLILVERLDMPESKPLWLIWVAKDEPILSEVWQKYLRRFAIEHWYRLVRQRLHWTIPQLSTPAQMETWSDLMPLLTWQLWLARELVQDSPLPWQKPMTKLSPGRVANAFALVLVRIGSPSPDPKPRGKSPGWPLGKKRTQRIRYPTVKKRYAKPLKKASAATA
ncbi:NF041680 family putative transposase [Pseudanabaena sp. PCC 6802]|uniref:NF041680 family putative transposase n=1 Tax=Pseudanabaena sp. PCC 6802 TaxID=118173 RepID=UPI0003471184|nr:NF041680 family putative transposase [Pseudanabaena sp. PCC 6802]